MEVAALDLIFCPSTTARGMARRNAYLCKALQQPNHGLEDGDSPYLPARIGGRHCLTSFLKAQTRQLRALERKERIDVVASTKRGPTLPESTQKLKGYLLQEMRLARTVEQALDELRDGAVASLKSRTPA